MDTNSGTRREDPPVPEYEQHVQDLDGDKVNIVTEQNDPVTRAEALDPPCTHDVQEAQRLERATAARLIKARKLSLVVDLDQTLVHATTSSLVDSWFIENKPASESLCKEMDIHRVILEDDESGIPHYIKLRNTVHGFLERISKKFELHIYTMGSHSYGLAVARLLDPTGTFFFDRIELSRIFPCEDAMVLILDDRSDVWTHSPNLIHVRPCMGIDLL
ncbi:hypothetical protein DI09_75p110 [Mitosporidium daphniae]|uniref:protein-serine/threonine phosphatase n=1 Tax=Mitosporidium daphniae TaxID=1485682 RepID=A0A098VRL6_9MICR|nr:uncharacterized protein DI09_75p110 [Mitosporidium daphniae]KGG50351.1 hypothetical protein DI09_75p110 [Mitosporidium daphniae]|eukprot:XP_013236778.1 uncharacterized protein DI09_75p110 [Mitosporidium daphniae]